jgi:phosphoglucomutase
MITASHNPPEYNGYKIYDETGCQLVPEYADQVIANVNAIENELEIPVKGFDELVEAGLIVEIGEEIDVVFDENVKSIQLNNDVNKSQLKIVFTPEHGTAKESVERILNAEGYNVVLVEEQSTPDPDFSGTKSANPEDRQAFDLAIEYGHKHQADILIATDPDADRLGVAVLVGSDYELLTGNQTGALLLDYIIRNRKTKGLLPENGIVFNTVVTSEFGAEVARKYGLDVESTLTGFKFIGDRIKFYEENKEKEFVFGYEESYGYLIKDYARDKDAVGAVLIAAEMAAFYKNEGLSLYDRLLNLYEEYGYFKEDLVALKFQGKEGKEKIQSLLAKLRQEKIEEVAGVKVVAYEDYLVQTRFEGVVEKPIALPKSNVLKFFLEDGSWFACRPSGTEPKIKFYIGVVGDSLEGSNAKVEALKAAVLEIAGV